MRRRRRYFVWLLAILLFIYGWMPAAAQAEVQWDTLSTLNLDKKPMDMVSSPDGKWVYVLTEGEVLFFDLATQKIAERVSVEKGVNRLAISARGESLYLSNDKNNTFSVVNVSIVQNIDVSGNPFKGAANAPVTIVVFSDFQ